MNELLDEIDDLKGLLNLRDSRIKDLEAEWMEQDDIINDMFDDTVEISDKLS